MLAWLFFAILHTSPAAQAQEVAEPPGGYRFQAPRPPPLDSSEIDEIEEEDDFEMGDEGASVPIGSGPPLPPAPPLPGGMPPPSEPRSFGGSPSSSGKLRFQLVEGEFWEKGKKRERGDRKSR